MGQTMEDKKCTLTYAGMPLNGHQKVGNLPTFCWFEKNLYWLKGKQAQSQQKEEKARIILIG